MPAGTACAIVFVAFIVVGFLALSLAEVSSRYDVTGGPQVYAQRVFGPATGFTVGWLFSVSRIASYARDRAGDARLRGRDLARARAAAGARRRDHRVHDRTDRDQCPRGDAGRLDRQPAHHCENGAARPDRDCRVVVRGLESPPRDCTARARMASWTR